MVAVPRRRRRHAPQVRARPRLGHRNGGHEVAGGQAGQPAGALLLGGQVDQVRDDDVVGEREPVAHRPGADDLLVENDVEAEVVEARPAVLLGRGEPDVALRGRTLPELSVDDARRLPGLAPRDGFARQEAAHGCPEVVVDVLEQRAHQNDRGRPKLSARKLRPISLLIGATR